MRPVPAADDLARIVAPLPPAAAAVVVSPLAPGAARGRAGRCTRTVRRVYTGP